ncbi:phosphotransferase enzyme family protein [Mariannaea sp. PMI_226]|nr:phosphotransferase enzyme family protein [Mariannaea sp. PMI_226]
MSHASAHQSASDHPASNQAEPDQTEPTPLEFDQLESDQSTSDQSESGSLKRALDDDDNVLVPMRYPTLRDEMWKSIEAKKAGIEEMVRLQLGVRSCRVTVSEIWKSGSFNLAIPIRLPKGQTIYLRLPNAYRIGEEENPGNAEEKLRTEIATYLWIQEHCPDVPIPILHAFGLPDGSTFTHPSNTPAWERICWNFRRLVFFLLGRPVPMRYVQRRNILHSLGPGFLLLSEARGEKLSSSWMKHCNDKTYRERLFRGLARVSLSLNATPFSRIGSMLLRPDGSIGLCNRPLNLYFQMLENEGVPSDIPRHRTYAEVESYLSDLLSLQDNKIRYQPNAVHDQEDGQMQLAALTALRATMHHFIRPEFRDGPFFCTLTDLHRQNIFVDKDWNIQTIIDIEWTHSLPIEMQLPPYWLTSRPVDGFEDPEAIAEYEAVLEEYLAIYEAEEKRRNGLVIQALIKRDVWQRGSFWYFNAVCVPKGMYTIFNRHIQPLFNQEHRGLKVFDEVFYWYWGFGAQNLLDKKLGDNQDYRARVKEAFTRLPSND